MFSTVKELLKGALTNTIKDVQINFDPKARPRRIMFQITFKDTSRLTQVIGKPEVTPNTTDVIKNRGSRRKT